MNPINDHVRTYSTALETNIAVSKTGIIVGCQRFMFLSQLFLNLPIACKIETVTYFFKFVWYCSNSIYN